MESYIMLIVSTTALLAVIAVCLLYRCYKQMEREKNSRIMDHIRRNERIVAELEHTRIEKELLEKILKAKIEKS